MVLGTTILSNAKGHFGPTDRPKWLDQWKWTTFKAGPEYSSWSKLKWSVPFYVPTKTSGILGGMESAPYLILPDIACDVLNHVYHDPIPTTAWVVYTLVFIILRSSFRGKSKCIMRECASERYCRKEWKTLIERLCTVDCGWVFTKVWFRGLNRQSRRNCNVVVASRLSRWCQNRSEFVVLVEGK